MPSVSDIFDQLQQANATLVQAKDEIATLNTTVATIGGTVGDILTKANEANTRLTTLHQDVQNLVGLQTTANRILANINEQGLTIICILEKISKNTCALWNEAHLQTALQATTAHNTTKLVSLFETSHPEAALEFCRRETLQASIDKCCPPNAPEPVCDYQPCPTPDPVPVDNPPK